MFLSLKVKTKNLMAFTSLIQTICLKHGIEIIKKSFGVRALMNRARFGVKGIAMRTILVILILIALLVFVIIFYRHIGEGANKIAENLFGIF